MSCCGLHGLKRVENNLNYLSANHQQFDSSWNQNPKVPIQRCSDGPKMVCLPSRRVAQDLEVLKKIPQRI